MHCVVMLGLPRHRRMVCFDEYRRTRGIGSRGQSPSRPLEGPIDSSNRHIAQSQLGAELLRLWSPQVTHEALALYLTCQYSAAESSLQTWVPDVIPYEVPHPPALPLEKLSMPRNGCVGGERFVRPLHVLGQPDDDVIDGSLALRPWLLVLTVMRSELPAEL